MAEQLLDYEEDELAKAGVDDFLWQAKPINTFTTIVIGLGGYHGFLIFFFCMYQIRYEDATFAWVTILNLLVLLIVPVLYKYWHNKGIHYYILKNGIYLQQYDWKWKPTPLFIPFKQIKRITLVIGINKIGEILIVTKNMSVGPALDAKTLPRIKGIVNPQEIHDLIKEKIN